MAIKNLISKRIIIPWLTNTFRRFRVSNSIIIYTSQARVRILTSFTYTWTLLAIKNRLIFISIIISRSTHTPFFNIQNSICWTYTIKPLIRRRNFVFFYTSFTESCINTCLTRLSALITSKR